MQVLDAKPWLHACRPVSVSGVAFAYGGQEIVASYTAEQIYTFSTVEHARPANAFSATSTDPVACASLQSTALACVSHTGTAQRLGVSWNHQCACKTET